MAKSQQVRLLAGKSFEYQTDFGLRMIDMKRAEMTCFKE